MAVNPEWRSGPTPNRFASFFGTVTTDWTRRPRPVGRGGVALTFLRLARLPSTAACRIPKGAAIGVGYVGRLTKEEGMLQLRASPAYRRAVWALRLMLCTPFLMVLSAVGAAVLTGPAQFLPMACTFGLALVAMVLGWSAVRPFSRRLGELLPEHPRDVFGAPVGVPTTVIRDVFRRKPLLAAA
jgi:hypothetical protein